MTGKTAASNTTVVDTSILTYRYSVSVSIDSVLAVCDMPAYY